MCVAKRYLLVQALLVLVLVVQALVMLVWVLVQALAVVQVQACNQI